MKVQGEMDDDSIDINKGNNTNQNLIKEFPKIDIVLQNLQVQEEQLQNQIKSILEENPEISISEGNSDTLDRKDKLFDVFHIIAPDITNMIVDNLISEELPSVLPPAVCYSYPLQKHGQAESIENFCFPRGIMPQYNDTSNEDDNRFHPEFRTFVMAISGGGHEGQDTRYASCMYRWIHFPASSICPVDMQIPICYCIIASYPFLSFFDVLLLHLLQARETGVKSSCISNDFIDIAGKEEREYIEKVLEEILSYHLPEAGGSITITFHAKQVHPFMLSRTPFAADVDEKSLTILRWGLPILLVHNVSIKIIYQIISCLAVEMRVIVVCEDLQLLSATILVATALLQPMVWAGPLITILPATMYEYIEAPVPYVLGVQEVPANLSNTQGVAIVFPIRDEIVLHAKDKEQLQYMEVGKRDELCEELDPLVNMFSENEASVSRKARIVECIIKRFQQHMKLIVDTCDLLSELREGNEKDDFTTAIGGTSAIGFFDIIVSSQMYQSMKHYQSQENHSPSHTKFNHSSPRKRVEKASENNQLSQLSRSISELFLISMSGCSTRSESHSKKSHEAQPVPGDQIHLKRLRAMVEADRRHSKVGAARERREFSPSFTNPTMVSKSKRTNKAKDRQVNQVRPAKFNKSVKERKHRSLRASPRSATTPKKHVSRDNGALQDDRYSSPSKTRNVTNTSEQERSIMRLQILWKDKRYQLSSSTVVMKDNTSPTHGVRDPRDRRGATPSPKKQYNKIHIDTGSEAIHDDVAMTNLSAFQSFLADLVKGFTIEKVDRRNVRSCVLKSNNEFNALLVSPLTRPTSPRHRMLRIKVPEIKSVHVEEKKLTGLIHKGIKYHIVITFQTSANKSLSEHTLCTFRASSSSQASYICDGLTQLILQEEPVSITVKDMPSSPSGIEAKISVKTAVEQLSGSEQTFLATFKTQLRRGIVVLKHKSRGKPHLRLLFCDETCATLAWKKLNENTRRTSFRDRFMGSREQEMHWSDVQKVIVDQCVDTLRDENSSRQIAIVGSVRSLRIEATDEQQYAMLRDGFQLLAKTFS